MSRERRRRTAIGEQFSPHKIRMLRSPAWCALSLSARRVLDRLEIELANHGGVENGRLPTTYADFQRYGIDRHAIAPAIREAVALGFLQITEQGRAGNAEWRTPNRFRLTFRNTDHDGPTDDWAKIESDEQARALARAARKTPSQIAKSQWGYPPISGGGNPHRKRKTPVGEAPTTAIPEKPPLLSISRGATAHAARTIGRLDVVTDEDSAFWGLARA